MNIINIENINQIPKLQTQLYISPLQKYHLKNMNIANKIYNNENNNINNNEDYNINNDSNNYNDNNSKSTGTEGRKFSKIK